MIEQAVKNKLKLSLSYTQIGDSFVRGGEIYVSKLQELQNEKAFFSECDERGIVNRSNLLYCHISPHPIAFTNEFLLDQPIEIIVQVLLNQVRRNRK